MKINCQVTAACIPIDISFLLVGVISLKVLSALFAGLFALAACSSSTPTPYVSTPIADLAAGTALQMHGKGMTWTENTTAQEFSVNGDKARLQKFDVTATDNVYIALFKNFDTGVSYGSAEFTMPSSMGSIAGWTDLGYRFTIQRNNENLIYTLSGVYTISLYAYGNPGDRFTGGGFATGSSTGDAAMPTTGAADYSGNFLGQSTLDGTVTGTATMHVEFGDPSSQITGLITNLVSTGGAYVFTDLNIQATFIPGAAYEGIVRTATSDPNNAFSFGTTGKIAGGFYGPNADEFGATIRITDGNGHILSGAISGTLDP